MKEGVVETVEIVKWWYAIYDKDHENDGYSGSDDCKGVRVEMEGQREKRLEGDAAVHFMTLMMNNWDDSKE